MSDIKNPKAVLKELRYTFNSGKTKDVDFRIKQLKALKKMYVENTEQIIAALAADLRKSRLESIIMEIELLLIDLDNTLSNIHDWVKPDLPQKGFLNMLDELYIFKEPYGVVLVIGAWNYPVQLTLLPVAGAIAAGNCVVIKPSEMASMSAKLMAELIPKYLDQSCYEVYLGGVKETTELLKEKFDYIFYTGSTAVGKIIQLAAAEHLTPTTLELGGKCPVFLDDSVDMEVAAKRILWGKCINLGQTCVAPDFMICTKTVQAKFIECAKKILGEWYGEKSIESPDLGRFMNYQHFQRVRNFLITDKIVVGGNFDEVERFIEPTILTNVLLTDPVMEQEVFGPVLPIINITDVVEVVNFMKNQEKPLCFYIFSTNRQVVDTLIKNVSSGNVVINETVMHLAANTLPFGGVGNSGMGRYHGKFSFDTFTHQKGCLYKNLGMIGEKLAASRYPPYSDKKVACLKFLLNMKLSIPYSFLRYSFVFGLGAITAYYGNAYLNNRFNLIKSN